MARPRPKKDKIQPIRHDETGGATAVAEPPPPEPEAKEPPPAAKPDKSDKRMTFLQRVKSIAAEDWGARAAITLYRLEPIIDRLRGSECKFVMKYYEPVDENKIKTDHGSGKYRLYLSMKTAGADGEQSIDRTEFDILDQNFPPKIPPGEWVDDIRNKKWGWAKPKDAGVQPDSNGTANAPANLFLESMKISNEMRRSMKEELAPPPAPPAADPLDQAAKLASLVKSLSPPPAPPTDDSLLKSIVTLQIEQMKADREEARELRNALFQQQSAGQKSDAKSQIKELIDGLKELAPVVKDIFPGAKEAVEAVRGGGRTNGWDIVGQLAPPLFDALGKIGLALATRMPAPPPGPAPQFNPQLPAPGQRAAAPTSAATPQAPALSPNEQQFAAMLVQPMFAQTFFRYFQGYIATPPTYEPGDFAAWLDDGPGQEALKLARSIGVDRVMSIFKLNPQWPAMAHLEAQLTQFVDGVVSWQPEPEEEEDEDEDEGVDLTTMEGSAE